MAIEGEQIKVESLSPAKSVQQEEVITIRPYYRHGARFYTCPAPACANIKFINSFKLRKHMSENHPTRRILVIDHPNMDISNIQHPRHLDSSDIHHSDLDTSDIRLVVDDSGTQGVEGDIQHPIKNTGKRKFNIIPGGQTLLSFPRKRQRRVIFDPSDRGNHRIGSVDESVDDPLALDDTANHDQDQDEAEVHNILVHGRDHCGVCSLEVETIQAGQVDQLQVAGQTYRTIINTTLGFQLNSGSSMVCTECENITTSIGHTRLELLRLQKKLSEAVSRLRDLFQLGRSLLQTDLEDGGLTGPTTCVRIVHDITQPQREAKNLGFTLGKSYDGCVVNDKTAREDDGSQVKALNLDNHGHQQDEISCLFLTQEEWARSGLTVWDGQVQVAEGLISGMAMGSSRPKFLLSQGICTDLGNHSFLCLDCDARFNRVTELLTHAENHNPDLSINQDIQDQEEYMEPEYSPSLQEIREAEECEEESDFINKENPNCDRLSVKLNRARLNYQEATEQDVKGSRREFRAAMHKAQFKECLNELPTLDKPFQCVECNKTFQSAMELWGHQNSFGTQTFDCNYGNCKEVFEKLGEFAVHYASHAGQQLVIPKDGSMKKTIPITCPVCNTSVTGLYKLQRHKMKHDPELKYKCPACPKQFVKANTMRRHITSIHKGEKYHLKCHLCELKLTNREGLTQHLREAHNVQSGRGDTIHLTCLKCALVCSNIEELRLHETGHLASATASMLVNRANGGLNKSEIFVSRDQPAVQLLSRDQPAGKKVSHDQYAVQVLSRDQPAVRLLSRDQPVVQVMPRSQQSIQLLSHDQPTVQVLSRDPPAAQMLVSRNQSLEACDNNDINSEVELDNFRPENLTVTGKNRQKLIVTGHMKNLPSTAVGSNSPSEDARGYRQCKKCNEKFSESSYLNHVLEAEKTGSCASSATTDDRDVCPECRQLIPQEQSLSDHLRDKHDQGIPRFQCSECEIRLITLQGCRRHYRHKHRGTPITCIICKETFSNDSLFHDHIASNHTEVIGPEPSSPNSPATCRYCDNRFMLYKELVIHTRFNHMIETIDISSTELEEVTMIGGHVVEFSEEGGQIVALHTIP